MEEIQLREVVDRLKLNDPDLTELDFRTINGIRSQSPKGRDELFDKLIEALSSNTRVRKVNIVLRFLESLSLEQKQQLFQTVGALPALDHLRVGSSGLSGVALQLISRALSHTINLKSLELQSIHFRASMHHATNNAMNTEDDDFVEFCRVLKSVQSLKSFALEDVEETFDLNALVTVLTELKGLQKVTMKSYKFPDAPRLSATSLHMLSSSTNIKSLELKRMRLHELLPAFILSLEENSALKHLNLEGNQMARECGAAIAYLLQFNTTLEELYVGCNLLPDESGREIANALSNNTSLKHLSLHTNFLDVDSATTLSNILMDDGGCHLEFLDLSQNSIKDEGGTSLALALNTNTTLKTLLLSETKVTKQTCNFLGTALAVNATLQRLNVADNKIDDDGCISLAEALKRNASLQSLNLYGSKISNVGVVAMARAMEENSSLVQLNLSGNECSGDLCREAMKSMIKDNMTLKHLWLPESASSPTITFFIKLNRIGREQLLAQLDNVKLWMQALLSAHDDVAAIHYLIRANPAVVSFLST
jgi:Ran GTPase-activating protein (RanGAP) involved in mRNA processing and transport